VAEAPFDRLSKTVFDVTTSVMGYDATWSPAAGGDDLAARVHLKTPTTQEELGDRQYDQRTYICEWKQGDWTGLDMTYRTNSEQVTVNGQSYSVVHVRLLADGQTYQGILQKN